MNIIYSAFEISELYLGQYTKNLEHIPYVISEDSDEPAH